MLLHLKLLQGLDLVCCTLSFCSGEFVLTMRSLSFPPAKAKAYLPHTASLPCSVKPADQARLILLPRSLYEWVWAQPAAYPGTLKTAPIFVVWTAALCNRKPPDIRGTPHKQRSDHPDLKCLSVMKSLPMTTRDVHDISIHKIYRASWTFIVSKVFCFFPHD